MEHEILWCEQCGEAEQTVSFETAGLCDECAENSIREALEDAGFGTACCALFHQANGKLAVCLSRDREEHDHS